MAGTITRWLQVAAALTATTAAWAAPGAGAAASATSEPQLGAVGAERLERAVGVELARRGIQLANAGLRWRFEETGAGHYRVVLEKPAAPECNRVLELGSVTDLGAPTLRRVGNAIVAVLREQVACPKPKPLPQATRTRVALLHDAIEKELRRSSLVPVAAAGEMALGGLFVTMPFWFPDSGRFRERTLAPALTSGGLALAGGLGALLAPKDYGLTVLGASTNVAFAGAVLSFALGKRSRSAEGVALLSGEGAVLSSLLLVLSTALRPPPLAQLRDAGERLDGEPSRAHLARGERLLRRTEPVLPAWLVLAPEYAGVGAAAVYALGSDDKAAAGSTLLASSTMLAVSSVLVVRSTWSSYQNALAGAGLKTLTLTPGPGDRGGLGLEGTF